MPDREDWLLLFIGLPGAQYRPDQIRVMKGMFLLAKEGDDELRDLYEFKPYDYGPFAKEVYHDLDSLEAAGLIRTEPVLGTSRRFYELTPKGRQRFDAVSSEVARQTLAELTRIKLSVTSLGFIELLREVYGKYPEYAARSVARL